MEEVTEVQATVEEGTNDDCAFAKPDGSSEVTELMT